MTRKTVKRERGGRTMDGRVKSRGRRSLVKSRGRRSLVKRHRGSRREDGDRFRCLLHDLP